MKIYAYRDLLEGVSNAYFGINLYFIRDETATDKIKGHIKEERRAETSARIGRVVDENNPVVQFIRDCIGTGIRKTPCYFQARKAGVGIRKQVFLALYEFLRLTPPDEETEEPGEAEGDEPPYEAYEEIQDYFREELEGFFGMNYIKTDLSDAIDEDDLDMEWVDDPGRLRHGDFMFEIGELRSYRFRYWGHWHRSMKHWKPWKMFNDFDELGLRPLLKGLT